MSIPVIPEAMFLGALTPGSVSHDKQTSEERSVLDQFRNHEELISFTSGNLHRKMGNRVTLTGARPVGDSMHVSTWWSSLGSWGLARPSLKLKQNAIFTWTHHLQEGLLMGVEGFWVNAYCSIINCNSIKALCLILTNPFRSTDREP